MTATHQVASMNALCNTFGSWMKVPTAEPEAPGNGGRHWNVAQVGSVGACTGEVELPWHRA